MIDRLGNFVIPLAQTSATHIFRFSHSDKYGAHISRFLILTNLEPNIANIDSMLEISAFHFGKAPATTRVLNIFSDVLHN